MGHSFVKAKKSVTFKFQVDTVYNLTKQERIVHLTIEPGTQRPLHLFACIANPRDTATEPMCTLKLIPYQVLPYRTDRMPTIDIGAVPLTTVDSWTSVLWMPSSTIQTRFDPVASISSLTGIEGYSIRGHILIAKPQQFLKLELKSGLTAQDIQSIPNINRSNRLEGGTFESAALGDIRSLSRFAGSILFVDRHFDALRYTTQGGALVSYLTMLKEYATPWNLQGEDGTSKEERVKATTFQQGLTRLKSVRATIDEAAKLVARIVHKSTGNEVAGVPNNFLTRPLRVILDTQIKSVEAALLLLHRLRKSLQVLNLAQGWRIPLDEMLYLTQVSTWELEHMFALFARKHGQLDLLEFKHQYKSMVIEHIKSYLPREVLGWVHHGDQVGMFRSTPQLNSRERHKFKPGTAPVLTWTNVDKRPLGQE